MRCLPPQPLPLFPLPLFPLPLLPLPLLPLTLLPLTLLLPLVPLPLLPLPLVPLPLVPLPPLPPTPPKDALIRLLSSLDNGRTWDLAKIQNQARWAASNALLILRIHGACYTELCKLLERGASVGECVLAIEEALPECNIPPPPPPPSQEMPVREVLRLGSPEFAARVKEAQDKEAQLEQQLKEVNERLSKLNEV